MSHVVTQCLCAAHTAGWSKQGLAVQLVQRQGAAGAHRGCEEGLAGGVGGQVQHGVSGLLGGQSQGGEGVHDQVEPQHLNCCQRGLLDCNRAYACRADRHNVHSQLQQTWVKLGASSQVQLGTGG